MQNLHLPKNDVPVMFGSGQAIGGFLAKHECVRKALRIESVETFADGALGITFNVFRWDGGKLVHDSTVTRAMSGKAIYALHMKPLYMWYQLNPVEQFLFLNERAVPAADLDEAEFLEATKRHMAEADACMAGQRPQLRPSDMYVDWGTVDIDTQRRKMRRVEYREGPIR